MIRLNENSYNHKHELYNDISSSLPSLLNVQMICIYVSRYKYSLDCLSVCTSLYQLKCVRNVDDTMKDIKKAN